MNPAPLWPCQTALHRLAGLLIVIRLYDYIIIFEKRILLLGRFSEEAPMLLNKVRTGSPPKIDLSPKINLSPQTFGVSPR